MQIPVVKNILEANDRIAEDNYRLFKENDIVVINILSAPGAGKTTLLKYTITALKEDYRIAVIEGDIQSSYDAEIIAETGVPVVQINTGGACHIDGNMVRQALPRVDLQNVDLLLVENVGNLVCPAEYKVGEDHKIMLLSVSEGDDKPLKYPLIFRESSVLLINKTDLLPYVDCDIVKIREESLRINRNLRIFEISCKSGDGLEGWYDWLRVEAGK